MNVTLSVNGLSVPVSFSDDEIEQVHLPILKQFAELHKKSKNQRTIIFLSAPPGTGKSTLTTFWEYLCQHDEYSTMQLPSIQTLPMDGFHHYNDWLEAHQLKSLKGAPETFDIIKLAKNIKEICQKDGTWPQYSRKLHNPIEHAITVTAPIVIIEGNWLLLNDPKWLALQPYCDLSIFIHAPEKLLTQRLIARKVQGGLSLEKAEAFYLSTDGPNVRKVLNESRPADLMLEMDERSSYRFLQN
ncbi:nucleoside/nucleotide kinase family protein [Providencia burhodogranariea]|uniref:Nucleoside triphosphate hydrolase domain-containing protein n=1 Tax=Providencia burhodogranariea DSM 19968 TaxID=1141662 RepID=K8WGM9_9GAMM|nr:nucleoside/nucleotide kinase family protein [Providencia burhodogranariea]EKT55365.1 nucleoside triphosphate hydrolase domain-containing protein [Providencia burhodogranariea DSM 19968]